MPIISNASFARNTDGKDMPMPLKIAIGKYLLGSKSAPSKRTALPLLKKMVAGKTPAEAERLIKTKLHLIDNPKKRSMAYVNPIKKAARTPEEQKKFESGIRATIKYNRLKADEKAGYNTQVLGNKSTFGSGPGAGVVGVGGNHNIPSAPISRI